MLTKIQAEFGERAAPLALTVPILGVTPKDSLLIRSITGLGPPDVELFIGDYSQDGGTYQGRRVGKRNPVITLDINPNPALGETVAGWREKLYKIFMDPLVDADYVKLNLFHDDGRVMYVTGHTEKFETDIFSVETMAQISIVCPDPYIREQNRVIMTNPPSGWVTAPPIVYTGTADAGFQIELVPNVTSNGLKLQLNNAVMNILVSGGLNFIANEDVVYINTERGQRAILMAKLADLETYRTSWDPTSIYPPKYIWDRMVASPSVTVRSLIPFLNDADPWLELHSQSNYLEAYSSSTSDSMWSIRRIEYQQAYWGV